MTPTAKEPLSKVWPTTVFHANGVKDQIVQNQEEFDRAMQQGWFASPQEPPPPPPPPMTAEESLAQAQSELEGLGDQVDAQGQTILSIEERISSVAESLNSTSTVVSGIMSMMQEMQTKQTQLEGKNSKLELAIYALRGKDIALDEALTNAGATFQQIDGRLTVIEAKKNSPKGAQTNGSSPTDTPRS